MSDATHQDLAAIARRVRGHVIWMSHRARAAHLASALSCIDLLVASYWGPVRLDPQNPVADDRDRFLLSKGHAAAALYATLAERGVIPVDELTTYGRNGSALSEQMSPGCAPGIEAATGSLGHGLPLGVGMALASRLRNQPFRVWVLMSDGECNEGSVWEAALFAAGQKLDNLTVLIDDNGWQATGRSREVLALDPLPDKWKAFGFATVAIDGHDLAQIEEALRRSSPGQPRAIVARTIKGRGVSFMEDDNNWHYRIPDREELRAALEELDLPVPPPA